MVQAKAQRSKLAGVVVPPRLPGLLQEIADATDFETAMAIARVRGGTRVYIPREPGPSHWLSQAVGHERALKVAAAICPGYGGLDFDIPLGRTRVTLGSRLKQVQELLSLGNGRMEVAAVLGLHYRTVQRYTSLLRNADQANAGKPLSKNVQPKGGALD